MCNISRKWRQKELRSNCSSLPWPQTLLYDSRGWRIEAMRLVFLEHPLHQLNYSYQPVSHSEQLPSGPRSRGTQTKLKSGHFPHSQHQTGQQRQKTGGGAKTMAAHTVGGHKQRQRCSTPSITVIQPGCTSAMISDSKWTATLFTT